MYFKPNFFRVLESYTIFTDKKKQQPKKQTQKTKQNKKHDHGIWTSFDIRWPWHWSLVASGGPVPAGDQAGVWWTLEVASTRLLVTQQNNDAPAREPEPSWGRCGTGGGLLCSVRDWWSPASMWCLVREEGFHHVFPLNLLQTNLSSQYNLFLISNAFLRVLNSYQIWDRRQWGHLFPGKEPSEPAAATSGCAAPLETKYHQTTPCDPAEATPTLTYPIDVLDVSALPCLL